MIDQCIIQVTEDRVQIKPELVSDDREDLLLDGWLPLLRQRVDRDAKHAPGETLRRSHSHFEIFADNALKVHTRSRAATRPDQATQFVYKIEINLRKILHGSNGVPIQNPEELCAALQVAKHAMSLLLVTPSSSDSLIPGIRTNGFSHWGDIEIALDIPDPGHAVRRQMRTMKTKRITKEAIPYPDSTILNGTNLELKAYDKIKQLQRRYGKKENQVTSSVDEITRLELKLKTARFLSEDLKGLSHSLKISKFGKRKHLTGFTWNDLKKIHLAYFQNVKGVYHRPAEEGSGSIEGQAAVLAFLATEFEIPLDRIRFAIENYGGRTAIDKRGSSRKVERKMLEFIENQSILTAADLLSDEAYRNPPICAVSGLEGARFYFEHYGYEEIFRDVAKIRAVYGCDIDPNYFIPHTSKDEWWR